MMDLDDVKAGGRGGNKHAEVADMCQVYKFPEKKWVTLRLMPGLHSSGGYWIKTKKRDGKMTKFPMAAPSWDSAAQVLDTTRVDPWRDLMQREAAADVEKTARLVEFGQSYWGQAIIRAEVKNQPANLPRHTKAEKASGFKDKESDSWTPVRVIRLPSSFARKLRELKELNTHTGSAGGTKAYSINDAKFGRDIRVYFDPDKAPAEQYNVQLGEKSRNPLTEEENAYLKWDLTFLDTREFDDKEVLRDFNEWAARMKVKVPKGKTVADDDEDDEEDDEAPKAKSKKPAPKKKPVVDDDEDDEDDFDEDEDEDEPAPAKSKKKKPVVADDDDEDDFDEDGDEEPAPKKKPAAKKKPVVADDEDEEDEDDFEEDDEEDDEDEAPKAKSKKPAPKKKPVVTDDDEDEDDDEDDFDEDEDEDEDEEPAPKKKKPVAKAKPAAKAAKKKPAVSDEDDEDF
jgi:hypothetical protein